MHFPILVSAMYEKIKKGYMKTTNLIYEDQHKMMDLNDLIETIIFLLVSIILCILYKSITKKQ